MRTMVARQLAILAMALTSTPTLADAASDPGRAFDSMTLQGRCEYRNVSQYIGRGNGFALCDAVVIDRSGDRAVVDFRQGNLGSSIRYEGNISGNILKIDAIAAPKTDPKAATGTCRMFWSNDRISTVTCVAKSGGFAYAANMRVRR